MTRNAATPPAAPKNRRAAKHLKKNYKAYKDCIAPDPNPVDAGGWTPLHKVAEKGHLELYRLIMSKCEDTNPANDIGITPFNWAARESVPSHHGHSGRQKPCW